jgi:hypothetical protein
MKKTAIKLKRLLEIEQTPGSSNVSATNTSQPSFASLDQAMDHYLFSYEKMALPNAENPLAEIKNKSLSKILFEADEMGLDGPPSDSSGGDGLDLGGLGGDDAGGVDNKEVVKLPQTPNINLEKFAADVARMINNREALLDIKNTMLRRVNAFMTQNYNPQMAEELMISLKTNYDLSTESPSQEIQKYQAPFSSQAAGDTLGGG